MRKALISIGSVAIIMSGAAMAQDVPVLGVNFGDVDLAATDAACGTAVSGTCSTLASGTGFIQRQIDKGGQSFIQTVIEESGFQSEDFVQIQFGGGGSVQGIASSLTVTEGDISGTGTGFSASSQLKAGWAETTAADSNAVITVNIAEAGATDGFTSDFTVDTDFNATTGVNTVNSLQAQQMAMLGSANDKQTFFTEIKRAGGANAGYSIPGGTGTASWAAGDQIQVVWVGQDMPDATLSPFGAQIVSNIEPGSESATSFNSQTEVGPWDWTAIQGEFTTVPTF